MAERVAVIVPCFNDGLLLAETVASLDEQEPIELVVIDDGSTDPETVRIVDRLEADSVRVVRHGANRGLVYARVTGLEATTAPYLFPLDSDDLAVPGALGRMADRLDADPDAVVCYGDYAEFGTHGSCVRCRLSSIRIAWHTRTSTRSPLCFAERLRRRRSVDASAARLRGLEPLDGDRGTWPAGHLSRPWRGLTFRKRFHGERMLHRAKGEHREIYRELRTLHPRLFAELPGAPAPLRHASLPEAPLPGRLRWPTKVRVRAACEALARQRRRLDVAPLREPATGGIR